MRHLLPSPYRLPLIMALMGIGMVLLVFCGTLVATYPGAEFKVALHWAVLVMGLAIIIPGMAAIYYAVKLKQEHRAMCALLDEEAKQGMTQLLKTEETRKKLEVALLQGQKLQAIGTLAGGIAHDFNNLIYAIKGYVEMAQEDVDKNTQVYKNLGKVLEAAQRGQDLTSRILAFGRRQHLELTAVSIKTLIESVLGLLEPTLPAVIFHFSCPAEDCIVQGDTTQLHQVIMNIIINAVDAMNREGTITIILNKINPEDTYLKPFSPLPQTRYCKIDIADTGHGMDPVTMERIFEPFYTTKEAGQGTGLGLSIVHSIVEHHHGKMTVESQPGRGTIFTVLLPERQEESP